MIFLIREMCLNHLKLEEMTEIPIKLSHLVKNKGKKLFNEDLKTEAQSKLLK